MLPYSFEDTFSAAKNVYEGELLSVEESNGAYTITTDVSTVYKGDYIHGETTVDIIEHSTYIMTDEWSKDIVEVVGKYLFMTGEDPEYQPEFSSIDPTDSCYRIIRILEDGSLRQYADIYAGNIDMFYMGEPPKKSR